MRKYLLDTGVLGAIFGGWSLYQATRTSPRDWRLALLWIGWLSSVALAFGAVSRDAEKRRREVEGEETPQTEATSKTEKKAEKKAAKAEKKAAKSRKVTLSI